MRHRPPRFLIVLIAVALGVGACTSGSSESPATTRGPTTTAGPTTTVAPTTTTTTLPPGLQPQTLEYGFADGTLWTHDVEHRVSLSLTDPGRTVFPDGSFGATTLLEGTQRTLALAGPEDGVFELAQDFTGTDGSLSISFGATDINQELSAEELRAFDLAMPPVLVAASGVPVEGRTGSPGIYEGSGRVNDILGWVGPVFGPEPLDAGDSWTIEVADPVLDTMVVTGSVVDEIETDDGFRFVVEFESMPIEFPITYTLEEALALGEIPGDITSLLAQSGLDFSAAEGAFVITDATTFGDLVFDPLAGIADSLTVRSVFDQEIEFTVGGETASFNLSSEAVSVYELTDSDEASSFQATAVLDRFEADPNDLALETIPSVAGYTIDFIDEETIATLGAKLDITSGEIAAGLGFARYIDVDGTSVNIIAMTNGGSLRGDPIIAEGIAAYWSDRTPTRVTIAGKATYRTTIDGNEWLFWSSDTQTFITVGARSASSDVMEAIIASATPYLWESGDCLDFREFDGAVPFSPFGRYGLIHCSQNHQYEVLYSEVLPEGPDSAFPEDIGSRMNQACGARFYEHTGAYPLDSSLEMIRYLPNPDEWDRGARYIACLIMLVDEDGPVTVTARLEGAGTEHPIALERGVCLANFLPVECDQPHGLEVVSAATYDAEAGAPYPDFGDVTDELAAACEVLFEEYQTTEGPFIIEVSAYTDMYLGWDNGLRTYYCFALATDDDGFLVDVIGSFTEVWDEAPEQVDA